MPLRRLRTLPEPDVVRLSVKDIVPLPAVSKALLYPLRDTVSECVALLEEKVPVEPVPEPSEKSRYPTPEYVRILLRYSVPDVIDAPVTVAPEALAVKVVPAAISVLVLVKLLREYEIDGIRSPLTHTRRSPTS